MINKRQYVILSFFLTRALFLGGGFSLLVNLTKNNLLLCDLIGTILGLIILYFLYKKESINKHVCSIIAIFVLFINTLSNNVLTNTYLLYNTPTLFIVLFFFFIVLYGCNKKIKVVGRVSEICVILSILAIILANIGLIPLMKLEKIFPLFNASFSNTLKGIIIFCGASLLPNILLLKYKENVSFKHVGFGYLLGCLTAILVSAFICSIYGTEFGSIVRFPEYLILKKIDIFDYITNMENVLVMEWIMNIIISAFICTITLKNNVNSFIFYGIIVSIILASEFLLSRNYVIVLFIKNYFYYIAFILVLIGLIFKKDKKQNE